MMHGIFREYVLKMCVHTPQAQSHSLALIEPIQEPKSKIRDSSKKIYQNLEENTQKRICSGHYLFSYYINSQKPL